MMSARMLKFGMRNRARGGTRVGAPPQLPELVRGYRPWLDGLRALAVVLVVVEHAVGPQLGLNLGGVGVGLFFGLSGYLITSLLLEEHARTGSVVLARFYLRRAARLLPALLLVVLVCDLAFVALGDFAAIKGSAAALSYTANYLSVFYNQYLPAFGQTWSLAVEEHFYLLWPLALLWVVRRFGLTTALKATLVVCLVAVLWRTGLAMIHAPEMLVSVGSLERADAMLYGCAAAIALRLGWRPSPWMTWAGFALVTLVALTSDGSGYLASIAGDTAVAIGAAAIVVGLDYAGPNLLRRLLSPRVLVFAGVLSYGIYLWHAPLMLLAEDLGLVGVGWRFVAVAVSFVTAWLSHRYVEMPVRSWARNARQFAKLNQAAGTPNVTAPATQ